MLKGSCQKSSLKGNGMSCTTKETYFLVGEFRTLEMAPKLLDNSNFLAARVTSGDSGLGLTSWSFFKSSRVEVDLTEVVITSDPSKLDVTTNMGIDEAPTWGWTSLGTFSVPKPPSDRVGLGGSYCLALLMGLPGSEAGRSESFQRPDCKELQRFLMYGAHLSIINSYTSLFLFWSSRFLWTQWWYRVVKLWLISDKTEYMVHSRRSTTVIFMTRS